MPKALLWLCLLLLPLTVLAQTPSDFRQETLLWAPINAPQDIVVNDQGHMYLLDTGGVTELDSQGVYIKRMDVRSPNKAKPNSGGNALGMDQAGNFYIGDTHNNEVRKFSATGQLLFTFGVAGTQPGQLEGVRRLTLDPMGNIYVVDAHRLQKFTAQGVFQWQFTPTSIHYGAPAMPVDVESSPDGRLFLVQSDYNILEINPANGNLIIALRTVSYSSMYYGSLARDAKGYFYMHSGNAGPIEMFSPQGAYLGTVSNSAFGYGGGGALTTDTKGNLFAINYPDYGAVASKLYKFNAAGKLVGQWGKTIRVDAIAFDRAGNFCVANGNGPQQQIIKYNARGQELFRFGGYGTQTGQFQTIEAVALDEQDNIYVQERKNNFIRIQKFNARGQFVRLIEIAHPSSNSTWITGLAVDPIGNLYVVDHWTSMVIKLNQQGQQLLTFGGVGTQPGKFSSASEVAVDGRGFVYVADRSGQRVQKFSPSGQFLRQNDASTPGVLVREWPVGLSVDATGTVFLSNAVDNVVRVYDPSGNYSRQLPAPFSNVGRVAVNRQGTQLLMVEMYSDLVSSYVATTPPTTVRAQVQGHIFHDVNRDCVPQAAEAGMAGVAVVAEPGNYYGISDENGNYAIDVDTGTYTIRQLLLNEPGRSIQSLCAAAAAIHVSSYGSTLMGPDFGNQVNIAPYLRVSVGSTRRRRCFRSTTTVSYSNTGFAPAANAQVKVALPPQVVFISATAPYTVDAAGNYVFQVGTLQPYDGGTIIITDSVVCGNPAIRGLTVCTKASITPLNTYPTPPGGNQATITVQGRVQPGSQVRFVLRNTTAVGMTDSLALRLYQNSELSLQHRYLLAAGDSLVLRVQATRPVVRMEADQPAGHPTQRIASSTVEVAALGTAGQPNSAMRAMPPNIPGPETAEECLPILDSYDPNDKQVVPAGTTAQHYTPTNVPLRYQVRFQNTGTDDAYRVVVVDTLAADLDLRTLHVTTASHAYHLTVGGHGRPVLTFTFDNINLPPSSRDAAGSNGFVQFSIQPKAALPAQTLVENYADIFFDYNPPIRTNTTANRLYDQPLVVVPAVALAYPAVLASPVVTQLAPAQGRVGTLVTIGGQRFASSAAANTVRFNGVATPVLSATTTVLTVRVPATATSGTVQVITGEGAGRSAQTFTVFQPPTLAVVATAEGTPGSVVTLTGTNFSPVAAQDTVWFGSVAAQVQQASATRLQLVVPSGAASGKIRVNTLGGQAESSQNFTVWYPPTLANFSPARGKAGDIITLTGSDFAPATRNAVSFAAGAGFVTQASGTVLQVRVPASAQTGPVQVVTPGGTAISTASFTFLPAPTIASFTPEHGSVGDIVTLTGTNFLVDSRPDTVYFAGVKALVLAATATTATVQVPKGAASGPLAMVGTGGRTTSANAFTLLDLTAAEAITVYPNPAHGTLTLDWHQADFTLEQVQVYNALGSLVTSVDLRHTPNPSLPLRFAAGQTGLHILVIQTSRGSVLKRIILL